MKRRATLRIGLSIACLAAFAVPVFAAAEPAATEYGGIFVGTTPCDAPVRQFLALRAHDKCDFIRWDMWIARGVNPYPNKLILNVEYGANGERPKKLKREGAWAVGVGIPEHPDANIYGISIGKRQLFLWKVNDETVHFLDGDRALLVGNRHWGYSLSIALANQLPAGALSSGAETPYKLLPLSSIKDESVVYEGRTPCAMGQVVGIEVRANCSRLDWRLTLFPDPVTHQFAKYRLEGSLFPDGAREGLTSLRPGTPFDPNAKVLMLEPPLDKEPVYLMRGDDNVLFFLDQAGKIGIGNRDFGYTLNRRKS